MKTEKIFAAVDCGAGNIKIRFGGKRKQSLITMPSLLAEVNKSDVLRGDAGVIDPSAFCMDGIYYYAGENIRDRKLESVDVWADPNLKVTNAKKLILAAIVTGLNPKSDSALDVGIVVSHHDPSSMGASLRKELEGTHVISRGNDSFEITLKLPSQGVFMEGSALGSLVGSSKFGVLDLGYLTALYSLRDSNGSVIGSANTTPNGVGKLITMLQSNTEFKQLLGGVEPNRDAIIEALMEVAISGSKKLVYRCNGKAIDFTKVYTAVIPQWLKNASQNAVSALNERKGTGFKVIGIGGGCNLPFVAATLKKYGVTIYGEGKIDPIYANVESLYEKHLVEARRDNTFVEFVGESALNEAPTVGSDAPTQTPHLEAVAVDKVAVNA